MIARVRWHDRRPSRIGDEARGTALGLGLVARVYATGNDGASAWSARVAWSDGRTDARHGHVGGVRAACAAVTAIVQSRAWELDEAAR